MDQTEKMPERQPPVPAGERVQYLLVGIVITFVLSLALSTALRPLAGHRMAQSVGTGVSLGVFTCFSNGYPGLGWRAAAAAIAIGLASGAVIGMLNL